MRYRRNGKVLAVASIFRDVDNLREETAMEHAGSRDLLKLGRDRGDNMKATRILHDLGQSMTTSRATC